jgi:hypothetical protein
VDAGADPAGLVEGRRGLVRAAPGDGPQSGDVGRPDEPGGAGPDRQMIVGAEVVVFRGAVPAGKRVAQLQPGMAGDQDWDLESVDNGEGGGNRASGLTAA